MAKSSEAVKKSYEVSLPDEKRVERRQIFGMPCTVVNGNMYCGIFQEDIMVRLSEEQRRLWMEIKKAMLVEPMSGRPMKEYMEVPNDVLKNRASLKALVNQSFDYLLTLKPEEKKVKKTAIKLVASNIRKRKN